MRLAAAAPVLASLMLLTLPGCRLGHAAGGSAAPRLEDCGADIVAAHWLGKVANAEVKAYIAARVGERPVRYYKIGDPITMDYNPARLNVEIGKDGLIKRFRCG